MRLVCTLVPCRRRRRRSRDSTTAHLELIRGIINAGLTSFPRVRVRIKRRDETVFASFFARRNGCSLDVAREFFCVQTRGDNELGFCKLVAMWLENKLGMWKVNCGELERLLSSGLCNGLHWFK